MSLQKELGVSGILDLNKEKIDITAAYLKSTSDDPLAVGRFIGIMIRDYGLKSLEEYKTLLGTQYGMGVERDYLNEHLNQGDDRTGEALQSSHQRGAAAATDYALSTHFFREVMHSPQREAEKALIAINENLNNMKIQKALELQDINVLKKGPNGEVIGRMSAFEIISQILGTYDPKKPDKFNKIIAVFTDKTGAPLEQAAAEMNNNDGKLPSLENTKSINRSYSQAEDAANKKAQTIASIKKKKDASLTQSVGEFAADKLYNTFLSPPREPKLGRIRYNMTLNIIESNEARTSVNNGKVVRTGTLQTLSTIGAPIVRNNQMGDPSDPSSLAYAYDTAIKKGNLKEMRTIGAFMRKKLLTSGRERPEDAIHEGELSGYPLFEGGRADTQIGRQNHSLPPALNGGVPLQFPEDDLKSDTFTDSPPPSILNPGLTRGVPPDREQHHDPAAMNQQGSLDPGTLPGTLPSGPRQG